MAWSSATLEPVRRWRSSLDQLHHGRRRRHTAQQVQDAERRQGVGPDLACWSPAARGSQTDFDTHHRAVGESCDHLSMKGKMPYAVNQASDPSWVDPDLSWLEFRQIDLSPFDVLDGQRPAGRSLARTGARCPI